MDDFRKYEEMHAHGSSPADVYSCAKTDGLDAPGMLRMLRRVFNLSLTDAKAVIAVASGTARSLSEQQEKLAPALEAALKDQGDKDK